MLLNSLLKRVTLPDARVNEYETDGFHRRIAKRVDGVRTAQWIYLDRRRPAAELDGEGRLVAAFVYAERGQIPSLMLRDGKVYRIVADQLGSPLVVVDTADGSVAQVLTYDEFGNVLSDTAPGFQPFGFAGGLYDRDTGLVRFGARDYDAVSGRWLTKDATRFRGRDTNLYRYAAGDPVNFVDHIGEAAALATAEVGAVAGTAACGSVCTVVGGAVGLGLGIWISKEAVEAIRNEAGEAAPAPPQPPAIPEGWDGTTPPAEGWEWRGPDAPGGERGAWVSPDGGQSLHPDFGHGGEIGPHVDWNDPLGGRWRIFPDGTCKAK